MLVKVIKNFIHGLIDSIEAQSIPSGSASRSLNWRTVGDKIELRRGMLLIGDDDGVGAVLGLHVTHKANGDDLLYKKYSRKLKYYDEATSAFIEVGTNLFPAAAASDEVAFSDYQTNAGAQMFFSSPNSGFYKVMVANPGSYKDNYDAAKNFKGYLRIKQNRTLLWHRNEDKTGLYGSYVDSLTYTTVTAEVLGSGNGVLVTFAGTLAAISAKRTAFGITVTDGVETFTDDYNGVLTGSAGGTGTINYSTGAISVTFAAAPANSPNNVTVSYQWEDSTNGGIADFTKSATRLAGQGFIFRQDDGGGDLMNVFTYGDTEYCMHEKKTWALTLGQTDTTATNLPYRNRTGIPNWRAGADTGSGVYHVDALDTTDSKFRILTLDTALAQVVPVAISSNIDLSDFLFDKAAFIEWSDLILIACRTSDSTYNNRVFIYDKTFKSFDVADYTVSCFAVYNGALVAGSSIDNNVYELFSGDDDDESNIYNYWEGNITDLDVEELKKTKRVVLQGEISATQELEVFMSVDRGAYVSVGTIRGDGDYVDRGQRVDVGAVTIGKFLIGGGGDGILAYNYERQLRLNLDKFEHIQMKLVANELGYVSVSTVRYFDIRRKGQKIPRKYRT